MTRRHDETSLQTMMDICRAVKMIVGHCCCREVKEKLQESFGNITDSYLVLQEVF